MVDSTTAEFVAIGLLACTFAFSAGVMLGRLFGNIRISAERRDAISDFARKGQVASVEARRKKAEKARAERMAAAEARLDAKGIKA